MKLTINQLRQYVRANIEQYAGRKATLTSKNFTINGMLSSTWQQSIPVCTVRGTDANHANIAIPFKQIALIDKTSKCFDSPEDERYLNEFNITPYEQREHYKHTGKNRIVFDITLKTGDKVELWINPVAEYANTQNILNKVAGITA